MFLDNFNGTAGSAPSQQNWLYDIGTGWGNKEVDHSTSSTSNVYLDGAGDLVIKAIDKNGTWTSGRYPDGYCDCTSPTSGTTSGGAMKVAYVAVDEQGGNSTPAVKATAAGKVTSPAGDCLANAKSLNTSNNPLVMDTCDGSDGQHWQTFSDGTLRTQGGCLDLVNGETSSGTLTQWFPCNGARSQVRELKSDGELYNPHSGRCLTSPGRGTPLDIGSCLDTVAQQFKLS